MALLLSDIILHLFDFLLRYDDNKVNGIVIISALIWFLVTLWRFIQYKKISVTNWKKLLIQILYLF